jgi:hypothetical protein
VPDEEFARVTQGELDSISNLVDRTLYRHMQDPLLIPLAERTDMLRAAYKKRPVERLPEDVTRAFDRLARCERERDQLTNRIIGLERRLGLASLKIWILGGLVLAEGGVIAWLANELMRRLH